MELIVQKRDEKGTSASRRLRHQGLTVGIVYGGTQEPQTITIDHKTLFYALKKEAFHSSILNLNIDGTSIKALLRDYQMHPYKPQVLHVDFQRVDENTKISVRVPLHFKNADKSPAVKLSGGMINTVQQDIEISCLPANLPEYVEFDLINLEAHHSVHAKDLTLPEGVELSIDSARINSVLITVTVNK